MSFDEHCCEECSHWDDINGCWAGECTRGRFDIACPHYDGPCDEDAAEVDDYDDVYWYVDDDGVVQDAREEG